jgi:hypothetical protein
MAENKCYVCGVKLGVGNVNTCRICGHTVCNSHYYRKDGVCPYCREKLGKEGQEGGGGCLITTAYIDAKGLPDNCAELTTVRAFRESYIRALPNGKEIISEYYEVAPRIIAGINKIDDPRQVYSNLYKELVSIVELINSGENGKALSSYLRILDDLKQRYL